MPKTKISEYSVTNSSNTDIEGINIDEGCAPSGINNAIRELMVHLKEFQTGASGDAFTFAGGVLISGTANTITGNVLMSGTNTITGSTTATFAAGAVGTPSIAAHGDTNTGIFFPAADTIAFAEGGAEAMRITDAGNLRIGLTSALSGYRLGMSGGSLYMLDANKTLTGGGNILMYASDSQAADIGPSVGFGGYYIGTSSDTEWAQIAGRKENGTSGNYAGYLQFSTRANGGNVTERMRIDSSGNVGIGTSSPNGKLHVAGTANFNTTVTSGDFRYNGQIFLVTDSQIAFRGTGDYIYSPATNTIAVLTNGTERARIAASGQMSLISTVDGLHVGSTQASGTATWLYRGASAATAGTANSGTDRFFVFTNGNVTNSNGSYGTISDAKLKQDIIDAGSQWADIKNLRFRKYRMKSDVAENPNAPYLLGFVAQELETISPGLIEEHPDTTIETKTREVEKTREIPAVLDDEGNEVEPARTETYTETEKYTEIVDLGTTTKSIKTSILYMKAVKALQEAMNRIETLEAQNAAFEARLAALEAK